jgi:hypothetical protein
MHHVAPFSRELDDFAAERIQFEFQAGEHNHLIEKCVFRAV